jgi:hypothetical protein
VTSASAAQLHIVGTTRLNPNPNQAWSIKRQPAIAMLHYQQQQHEGHFAAYPPHLVDTQYMEVQTPGPDSVDELSGLARNQYFTPDQNQNQDQADQLQHELDTWRRNVQMAMPQQSDIISQGTYELSLFF